MADVTSHVQKNVNQHNIQIYRNLVLFVTSVNLEEITYKQQVIPAKYKNKKGFFLGTILIYFGKISNLCAIVNKY